jgi:hypothetical protein
MKMEGYIVADTIYYFCPACKVWGKNPHGEGSVVGPASPEVRADIRRRRPRGPHYHEGYKLPHSIKNAVVQIDGGTVSIDLRTTAFRFTGDGLYAWRLLAQQHGKSHLETPQRVVVEEIKDVDVFLRAAGKDIERWLVRETCPHA